MSYGMKSGDNIPEGYQAAQLQQFTPEQMNLFKQLFSHVGPDSFLSKIASGDQGAFAQAEAPALRQFNQLQGNIASRFSGMGMGGRKGSGFQNTLTAASQDFAQNLQSQRMNYQQQAIKDLIGLSGDILHQKPYERMLSETPKPWYEEAAIGAAQGFGQGAGQAAGRWVTGGF